MTAMKFTNTKLVAKASSQIISKAVFAVANLVHFKLF